MKQPILFILATLLALPTLVYSQKERDKQILKLLHGKRIEWGVFGSQEVARVKIKKKWGLYSFSEGDHGPEPTEIIPPVFDSIGWFKGMSPFAIVKNEKKYGILLNPYEIMDAVSKANCIYSDIKTVEKDDQYFVLVKQEKWGLFDWFEGKLIYPCTFDTPDEIPLQSFESRELDMVRNAQARLGCDLVIMDHGNGDGVFKARNAQTKKWGMFQDVGGPADTLIPMAYDSLKFFRWNGDFTAVYQAGKVGIYLSKWSFGEKAKEVIPCIYEDYAIYKVSDGTPVLAVQKDGKWGWINWLTGEVIDGFKAASKEDLPPVSYYQATSF
ncbi:MAG: hypothetical protein GC180_01365 [Bacteroidetes bacterium]|nr:hypothetical protein [Bacteroidota bacterium]